MRAERVRFVDELVAGLDAWRPYGFTPRACSVKWGLVCGFESFAPGDTGLHTQRHSSTTGGTRCAAFAGRRRGGGTGGRTAPGLGSRPRNGSTPT